MAALLLRNHRSICLFSRLRPIPNLHSVRYNHAVTDGGLEAEFRLDMGSETLAYQATADKSKWKKLDARVFGIKRSMIPHSPWTVLKVLRYEGFEAYLVGGCVRDLILNRIPKDFDVITTAKLNQVRKRFRRCMIVGKRFPICRVLIRGSVVEVSSFETVSRDAEEKDVIVSQVPSGCDERDFALWMNSMRRDFTVNSLFLDPFILKIYDYVNGVADLRSLQLHTLVPAELSFATDCARILRGLRIAARLGLSLSKETETALRNLSSSVKSLGKTRLLMELNYMMSYGAAEASFQLLWRFKLLEILLPLHAAYLDHQASKQAPGYSMMLMRLFFHLDKLVTCDRPSDCILWVALLAFHLALVNNPQNALTIWALASTLYHGRWMESFETLREKAQSQVEFVPEISSESELPSDKELADRVASLAVLVQESLKALTETDSLVELMSRYPNFPCPGVVFVPRRIADDVSGIFQVLANDIKSYEDNRESSEIDYNLLGKGNVKETRFVLGKIILETLSDVRDTEVVKDRKQSKKCEDEEMQEYGDQASNLALSDVIKQEIKNIRDKQENLSTLFGAGLERDGAKRQKLDDRNYRLAEEKRDRVDKNDCLDMVKMHSEVVEGKSLELQDIRTKTLIQIAGKCRSPIDDLEQMKQSKNGEDRQSVLAISDVLKQSWPVKREERPGLLLINSKAEESGDNRQKLVKSSVKVKKHLKVLKLKCPESLDQETMKQVHGVEEYGVRHEPLVDEESGLQKKKEKTSARENSENYSEGSSKKKGRHPLSTLFR